MSVWRVVLKMLLTMGSLKLRQWLGSVSWRVTAMCVFKRPCPQSRGLSRLAAAVADI